MNERPPALAGLRHLLAAARETDRRGLYLSVGMGLLAALVAPLFPLLFKVLIDAALRGDRAAVVAAALGIAACTVGAGTARSLASLFSWNLWERMTVTLDERLVGLHARLGLIERAEQPDYVEHLTLVRTNREHFQESVMSLIRGLLLGLQVLVTVAILATVAPVLLLLPLLAAAPIAASRSAEQRAQQALSDSAGDIRTADGLALLALDAPMAGELRVLRLRDLILERHLAAWERSVARQWRAEGVGALLSASGLLVFTAGFAGAVLYVTARSIDGAATLGSVILVLTAGQQLHNQIAGALASSGDLFRIVETMRHYAWLVAYVDEREDRGAGRPDSALREGIALERVSFRYPAATRDALHDVTLTLPAGAVVAVVGDNGAGKSTLVRILCGLHEPSSGAVVVDGRPLAELAPVAWRDSLSAAFQDFVRFELLARESIGTGRIDAANDPDAVRAALAAADVAELEHEMPDGLETPLGRAFLDGIDLSGGEWQKLALARSMMRSAPLVLALDEPTYSLDVESERRVFEWFSRVAKTDNPAGTITIIVSHRFSTVRAADLIAVIAEGQLAEVGTHADLLARDGAYATMYRTQADGYR
jgi:ATP-binding cassette subfamily B protein